MNATRFTTKEQAQQAADIFPLAGVVWISGAIASVERLAPGWYVAFPKNVSRRYLQDGDVERAALSVSRHNTGWI